MDGRVTTDCRPGVLPVFPHSPLSPIPMHRLPNPGSVRRFRLVALCVFLKWLLLAGGAPLMAYAMMVDRKDLSYIALGMMGGAGLTSIGHWIAGARARCPLCFVPSFSHQQQSKSRRAYHFLGSYRIFVALSVLFRGWFHCAYCGENTAMEARKKNR